MTKEAAACACKICETPFTVFRWKAGAKGRFKCTVICSTCAKLKNVCQTCIFDLQYGLPVQLRDKVLEEHGATSSNALAVKVPMANTNRDYYLAQNAEALSESSTNTNAAADTALRKIARMEPNYERNLPKLCSFFAKGECNRGSLCPFRHEKGREGEGKGNMDEDIRQRFYGSGNDKIANNMNDKQLDRIRTNPNHIKNVMKPPEDITIRSLFVMTLPQLNVTNPADLKQELEETLKSSFYSFGEISNIHIIGMGTNNVNAFVEYSTRAQAEHAMKSITGSATINGVSCRVVWAKGKGVNENSGKLFGHEIQQVKDRQSNGNFNKTQISAVGMNSGSNVGPKRPTNNNTSFSGPKAGPSKPSTTTKTNASSTSSNSPPPPPRQNSSSASSTAATTATGGIPLPSFTPSFTPSFVATNPAVLAAAAARKAGGGGSNIPRFGGGGGGGGGGGVVRRDGRAGLHNTPYYPSADKGRLGSGGANAAK